MYVLSLDSFSPSHSLPVTVCRLGDHLAKRTFSQELADLKGPQTTSSSDYSALTSSLING